MKNLLCFANMSRTVELIISKCGMHHLWTLTPKSYKTIYYTLYSFAARGQYVSGTRLQREQSFILV